MTHQRDPQNDREKPVVPEDSLRTPEGTGRSRNDQSADLVFFTGEASTFGIRNLEIFADGERCGVLSFRPHTKEQVVCRVAVGNRQLQFRFQYNSRSYTDALNISVNETMGFDLLPWICYDPSGNEMAQVQLMETQLTRMPDR